MSSLTLPDLPNELLFQLSALLIIDDPASLLALERTCRSLRTFFLASGVYDDALRHFRLLGLPDPSPAPDTREYFRVCFTDACDRCGNASVPLVRLWFFKSVLCEACATDDEIWITRDEILDSVALSLAGQAAAVSKDQEDDDMNIWRAALLGLPLQAHTIPYSDEYTMFRKVDVAPAMLECVSAIKAGNTSKWFVKKQRGSRTLPTELKMCYKRDKILQDWTDKTKAGFLAAKLVRDFPEKFGDTSEEDLRMCPSFLRFARRPLHQLHHDSDVLREEYRAMAEVLAMEAMGELFKVQVVKKFDLAVVSLQPDQVEEVRKLLYCKICREERPGQMRPYVNLSDIVEHRMREHKEVKQKQCFGSIREIWETL